jgi:hypothetical protein
MGLMKLLSVVCLPLVVLAACSSCSSSTASKEGALAAGGSSTPDSLGKATFSATIDGVAVTGGAIDGLQQNNAAYTIPDPKGGDPKLLFWLFDTKAPDDQDFVHSIKINLPKKIGTTDTAYITANIVLSKDHFGRYSTSKGTVTITSITSTRVTGTFSALKMGNSPDTPNVPHPHIDITDGKFDIPFATSKMYPM